MDNRKEIVNLLTAYLNNQVTREEFDRLFADLSRLEDADFEKAILQALDKEPNGIDADFIQERVSHLYPKLQEQMRLESSQSKVKRTVFSRKIWRIAVAAAVILAFLTIGFYFLPDPSKLDTSAAAPAPETILPGGSRATLKLSNGQILNLNAGKKGILMERGLAYLDGSAVLSEQGSQDMSFMQLTTPNGGEYRVTLSDGTQVLLNAASTLSYPAEFGSKKREVTLEGEAYFEVEKDPKRPFIVKTAKQHIEVLGTSFNINAYKNETTTKTTLLTGSVRVNALADSRPSGVGRVLKPNQQSVVSDQQTEVTVNNIDPESAIAWKNGLFNFHGLSIDEALKQVERWYDIRIVYSGEKPGGYLGGKMSRGVKLSTFLDFLERDFRIKSEMKPDRTLVLYTASDNPTNHDTN